ncbi:MAG: FAD:protein FMN transferase [Baekduiaceae bacterium]
MLRERVVDRHLAALGTDVRVACTGPGAERRTQRALAVVRRVERPLSRFRPDSELSQLNADRRREVPASALLRDAVRAALWAARHSDGLVDPTLLGALERAGYTRSMAGATRSADPLSPSPNRLRRGAQADPSGAWQDIRVDDHAGTISRPPGVRLDLGGTGKGYAADLAAAALEGAPRWLVDCGGDLRVGGAAGTQEVQIAGPGDTQLVSLRLAEGAVATSGIHARRWTGADGDVAHHLLDPSTGDPAWTGLAQVTAVAGTVLTAETLAKTALLRGPEGARALLRLQGGVLVHDDGRVEHVGRLPIPTAEEALA